MRMMSVARGALIGLVGFICSGCLEAGPRGYFDNSVYGSSDLRARVVDHGRELHPGTRRQGESR